MHGGPPVDARDEVDERVRAVLPAGAKSSGERRQQRGDIDGGGVGEKLAELHLRLKIREMVRLRDGWTSSSLTAGS